MFLHVDISPPVVLIASWRDRCAVSLCSQRGITPSFSLCIGTFLVLADPPSAIRLHAPGQAYQFSRASSHAMQGTWQACTSCSTRNPASNLPADSGSVPDNHPPDPGDTRPKPSQSFSLARAMTPVSRQGGERKGEEVWTNKIEP